MLIINADDWGRSHEETDRALACYKKGRITSATAMVFMQDSARAAEVARDSGIDTGLHLNFSQNYTDTTGLSPSQIEAHNRIVRFFKSGKYAVLLYNPFLRNDFQNVFLTQKYEYFRLYGKSPSHLDGHQHLHLCANMLLDALIPSGEKVRRSFSFFPGEKNFFNLAYRRWVDTRLAAKHRLTQYFFALSQHLDVERLGRVVQLASGATVELMTHPIAPREGELLLSEKFLEIVNGVPLGNYTAV
jgi:predicted glycoside hydrolase/deacetylase ChbG (UPF0249 family)